MTQNYTHLFHYIDEDKKYLGFTLLEIGSASFVMLIGFVLNYMVLAVIGCFSSTMIIRYINHLLKMSSFKRMMFFYISDLVACSARNNNIYAKYYL